ncbi:MAG: hypothetical protein LC624_11775 [Halobacteriales archaeon]|nr:hypothetical protein [Halobacteriales archaeon]
MPRLRFRTTKNAAMPMGMSSSARNTYQNCASTNVPVTATVNVASASSDSGVTSTTSRPSSVVCSARACVSSRSLSAMPGGSATR